MFQLASEGDSAAIASYEREADVPAINPPYTQHDERAQHANSTRFDYTAHVLLSAPEQFSTSFEFILQVPFVGQGHAFGAVCFTEGCP